ncbi:MAG TPA: respiratory nitrate reductase subunit gamma [Telmatospirillum sp.]|nr:respiratory nitrate reductase subunit gamma [Telmatospirillum sp.]
MNDLETPVQLSYVAVAYALMFYGATVILLAGLIAKIWNSVRHPARLKASIAPSPASPISGTIRLASEVVLFRSVFFNDRWNWIFGTCFHFGLLLVLLRHLRYALAPSWIGGVLWQAVVIVQPFGLYGGFALIIGVLGFALRRILLQEVRRQSGWIDHLLILLLLLVPVTGYLSGLFHTDVVAVKDFFIGMATGNWKPLPTDGLLLTHLWLVAVMMVVLPFGKMLHFGDIFEAVRQAPVEPRKLKRVAGAVLALLLLAPAVIGIGQVVAEGWTKEMPNYAKLIRAHRSQDQTVMIRNHPNFLMHKRGVVVYSGVRSTDETIERCVTCHVVKDAGQPVDFENPKHFCTACHNQAAVTIDCFECHNSKPVPPVGQSAIEGSTKFASIKDYFAERSSMR